MHVLKVWEGTLLCRHLNLDLMWFSSLVQSVPEKLPQSLHAPYKVILFSGTLKERMIRFSSPPLLITSDYKHPHEYFLSLYPAECK